LRFGLVWLVPCSAAFRAEAENDIGPGFDDVGDRSRDRYAPITNLSRPVMTLTTEQRREINRENGKKSQGPKTDEGKAKSRQNALKHGLRAEVLAMVNEDPKIIAARAESWNDYYQPASPAAQHLVNECVRATILSDRCHTYHDAALAKQVRESKFREICNDAVEVERLVAQLAADPANTVSALMRFGAGCRYLIERWEHLGKILETRGWWTSFERDEATRLLSQRTEDETIKENEITWSFRLFNAVARGTPTEKWMSWMIDPKHFPQALWSEYGETLYPSTEDCRGILKDQVATSLKHIRAWYDHLAEVIETPNTEAVADRALILQDEPSAKLFLRYLSESRSSFHRSFKELVTTLERDRAEGATPLAVSPNEPTAEAVEEPETPEEPAVETEAETKSDDTPADSPNEPNPGSPAEPDLAEKPTQLVDSNPLPPEQQAA
jgi:hypothetical protein